MPMPNATLAPCVHDPLMCAFFGLPGETEFSEDARATEPQEPALQPGQHLRECLDDSIEPAQWSEEDVVLLHWRLLLELRRLPDPATPLADKLETLEWALTDPALDSRPFSFANCLRVVGTSPLSPAAYCGDVQVDDIRDWLRSHARQWIRATLEQYDPWVQALVSSNPHWVAKKLRSNPQWLNEQIKAHDQAIQPDLFGSSSLPLRH
jgi:hypothetical protein